MKYVVFMSLWTRTIKVLRTETNQLKNRVVPDEARTPNYLVRERFLV